MKVGDIKHLRKPVWISGQGKRKHVRWIAIKFNVFTLSLTGKPQARLIDVLHKMNQSIKKLDAAQYSYRGKEADMCSWELLDS